MVRGANSSTGSRRRLFTGGCCCCLLGVSPLPKPLPSPGLVPPLASRYRLSQGCRFSRLIVVVALTVTFLTEITSNTATTTLLMPILAAASLGAGFDPALLMLPAALSASCAFMLPVATAPNAIVFGTGEITVEQMVREGFRPQSDRQLVVISAVVYLLAGLEGSLVKLYALKAIGKLNPKGKVRGITGQPQSEAGHHGQIFRQPIGDTEIKGAGHGVGGDLFNVH